MSAPLPDPAVANANPLRSSHSLAIHQVRKMEKSLVKVQQYEPKWRGLEPDKRAATGLPALGHKLPASFKDVEQACHGILYVGEELWRLEKTVALIWDISVAKHPETIFTLDLLDILRRNILFVDLGEVHRLLVTCLAPLNSWTAAIVDDPDEALAYEYARMLSRLDLSRGLAAIDALRAGLSQSDKYRIAMCIDSAEFFLQGQDELYEGVGPRFVVSATTGTRTRGVGNLWKKLVGRGHTRTRQS